MQYKQLKQEAEVTECGPGEWERIKVAEREHGEEIEHHYVWRFTAQDSVGDVPERQEGEHGQLDLPGKEQESVEQHD